MTRHHPDWYRTRCLMCDDCKRILTTDWSVIRGKLLCPDCATATLQAQGALIKAKLLQKRPEFDV